MFACLCIYVFEAMALRRVGSYIPTSGVALVGESSPLQGDANGSMDVTHTGLKSKGGPWGGGGLGAS